MVIVNGRPIAPGIAIGPIYYFKKQEGQIVKRIVSNPTAEEERFNSARGTAVEQLGALHKKALKELGGQEAEIFEVHQMLAEDGDFSDAVLEVIRAEHCDAAYAVEQAGIRCAGQFASMDGGYMKERAVDIRDVASRICRILEGRDGDVKMQAPSIVLATELTPSETMQMDRTLLLAFITREGSANSHTGILARNMAIPVVSGVDIEPDWHGRTAIIDGFTGTVYIEPDQEILAEMQAQHQKLCQEKALFEQLRGKASVTRDGTRVEICANIGDAADIELVLKNDAEGIGLLRSEFLYLSKSDFPAEEELFEAYRAVVTAMDGKRVVIRTLDIGADKQADYFGIPTEENPALGMRAIRICLTRPDIFRTQLRAILRATAYGNVAVMFPMIISTGEVLQCKAQVRAVQAQLEQEGVTVGSYELGIMIETPAAVIMSDELAEEVDFFSIGTNDLTQYMLAVDRQNPALAPFCDTHHPALLRAIDMVTRNAHKCGCWVGICGELAGDLTLTETFLKMGVDELSVSPPGILALRRKVCSLDLVRNTQS